MFKCLNMQRFKQCNILLLIINGGRFSVKVDATENMKSGTNTRTQNIFHEDETASFDNWKLKAKHAWVDRNTRIG
jgi:hypothetical protein